MKYDKNSFVKYESAQSFALETIEALMRGEGLMKSMLKRMDIYWKKNLICHTKPYF